MWNSYNQQERSTLAQEHGSKDAAYAFILNLATQFHRGWIQSKPKVVDWWHYITDTAFKTGELSTVFGRKRRLSLVPNREKNRDLYEDLCRHLINFTVQSTATDITQMAMVRTQADIEKYRLRAHVLLMMYDSIWVSCDVRDVKQLDEIMEGHLLSVPIEFGIDSVPFKSDVSIGLNAAYTIDMTKFREVYNGAR